MAFANQIPRGVCTNYCFVRVLISRLLKFFTSLRNVPERNSYKKDTSELISLTISEDDRSDKKDLIFCKITFFFCEGLIGKVFNKSD